MAIKTWSTPAGNEQRRPVPCALCGGTVFRPKYTCRQSPDGRHGSGGRDDGTDGGEAALSREEAAFSYVRCARCGLVQMNPQPEADAVHKRYGALYGSDYLSYETANETPFLQLQKRALSDAGFFELEQEHGTGSLLDIGCATGALIAALAKRGWRVRGLELSGPQAEYCRARGLEVDCASFDENGLQSESFDAVTASHLIEHLNRPENLVREAYRLLKRGGRLYITTPNIDGFQARLFGGRWRSAIFDHLYLFSRRTLAALLEREGFRIERCRTWGGLAAGSAPQPVKALFDKAVKILGLGDVMILRALKP